MNRIEIVISSTKKIDMANNKQCPTCGQDYPKYSTHEEVNETPIEELIEKHTGMKYEDYLKQKQRKKPKQ